MSQTRCRESPPSSWKWRSIMVTSWWREWIKHTSKSSRFRRRLAKAPRNFRLWLEPLEGRLAPATLNLVGATLTFALAAAASARLSGTGTARAVASGVGGAVAATAAMEKAGGGLGALGAVGETTTAASGLAVDGGGQGESLTLNGGSAAETIGVSAS